MRILHMADLHVGKSLNGFSLLPDQQVVFGQIVAYARSERVQAAVVAGDVYDRQTPSAEAVRLFDDFLTALSAEVEAVLIVSGNHDSPDRLAFAGRILEARGIHLRCDYTPGRPPVTLEDAHGAVDFHLLPFLRPASVRRYFEGERIDGCQEAVLSALSALPVDAARRNVVVAHQFFAPPYGEEPQRSDSEAVAVGGLDRVDAALLDAFDYAALGHLHGPQRVGREEVRYAGSPLKYSFSECFHRKSVVLADVRGKGDVRVDLLPLAPPRDLRRIRGPLADLLRPEIVACGNREDYLHVTLTDEDTVLDAAGKLRSVYPNVMAVAFDNARSRAEGAVGEDAPLPERRSPDALFGDFFLAQNGAPVRDDLLPFVEEALAEAGCGE